MNAIETANFLRRRIQADALALEALAEQYRLRTEPEKHRAADEGRMRFVVDFLTAPSLYRRSIDNTG